MTDTHDTAHALRVATTRLARRLRHEAGQDEYSPAQVEVFHRLLRDGPATISELARAENVRPQSMSTTVAALEQAGLVARRPHPDDGRAVQICVTADGESRVLRQRAAKDTWLTRELDRKLTAAEQRTLHAAAALIERLLES